MNKKFLSAILFGALMVSSTGTFVSCKDYDDDIDSLQKQIDAQKALGDKLSTVETSIATLTSAQNELKSLIAAAEEASKKAAEAAQSAATAAGQDAAAKAQAAAQKFAEEAALKAQSAALEGAKKELETTKAALTELINKVNADAAAQTAAVKAELTASINKELATISGKLETVQTSLSESISKLDTTVDGLHATVGGLTVNVEDLNTAVDGLGVAVAALETESKTVSNQVNGLTEKLNEQIANTAKEIASLKEAMDLQEKTVKEYADKLNSTTLESVKANEDKILALQETTIPALVERIGALEDALDTLANLKDVTDLANNLNGLNDKVEGIEGDLTQLDTDLKALIDTEVKKLSSDIQSINNNLDQVWSTFATGITHVSLVSSYTATGEAWDKDGVFLNFSSIIEKENIFGKELTEPLVFEKGRQTQRPASFIIRVSPTSANVTKDMITLQNSKGEKLDIVNIKEVEIYDKLLSRTVSKSGLFEVTAMLTEYDEKGFNAVKYVDVEKGDVKDNHILYAVSINDSKDAEATREVVSSYDMTLDYTKYVAPSSLEYFVGNKNVDEINNRYKDNSESLKEKGTGKALAPELEWKNEAAVAANKLNNDGTPKADSNAKLGDDRSEVKYIYPAVQNEEITISLKQKNKDGELVDPTDIRAMYVTLDHEANAIESAPSEWNAWNSYGYTGLDQIVEGTSTKISVSPKGNQKIVNDIIGFRVYAVNYDGTLVDPDGRAFYVRIGKKAIEIPVAETEILAINTKWGAENPYSEVYELPKDAFKGITGIKSYEWIADGINNGYNETANLVRNNDNGFKVQLMDKDHGKVLETNGNLVPAEGDDFISEKLTVEKDLSGVVAIKTQFNHSIRYVLDGTTLNGTLVLKDANDFVVATLKVSAKKVMPTSAPNKFSVKDNQIVNGVYNCYLEPTAFNMGLTYNKDAKNYGQEVATNGTKDMKQVFNGWVSDYVATSEDGTVIGTNGYKITLANTAKDNDGNYTKEKGFGCDITIPAALIDNKAEHTTKVEYIYAGISTYVDEEGKYHEAVDYPVGVIDFKTVYNCYMEKPVQTWRWITAADQNGSVAADGTWYIDENKDGKFNADEDKKLTQPTTSAIYSTETIAIKLADIWGTNTYNNTEFGGTVPEVNESQIRVVGAKITSNISGEEDYFKFSGWGNNIANFVKNSGTTNPAADVASTLTIVYIDMYGHVTTAEVPFTVKRQ